MQDTASEIKMGILDDVDLSKREARDKMVFFYYDKKGHGHLNAGQCFDALQAAGALVTQTEFYKLCDSEFCSCYLQT